MNILNVVFAVCIIAVCQSRALQAFDPEDIHHIVGAERGPSGKGIDLRPKFKERMLAVRHQGQRGACQVFAMLGVIEYQLSKPGKPLDLSEQYVMWSANDANGFERTEGFYPEWLIKGLRKYGVCSEDLMPYVGLNETITPPSFRARANATNRLLFDVHEIKHWKTDAGYDDEHIREIKEILKEGEPVTATFRWASGTPDRETYDDNHFYLDRNIRVDVGGHGVMIVGYKMDESVAGGGYFIIRNSWGTRFGDQGHVKITFAFAKRHGIDAYRVKLQAANNEK